MPVIDRTFLVTLPTKQLSSGVFVRVPFPTGANSSEGTAFGERSVELIL